MIDWTSMIQLCAPEVHVSTMQAIIRTESGFNPLAMNINGGAKLPRQPKNKSEAIGWARWLIQRGYSVDLGLMQINSANLPRLGVDAASMFDPCKNLQAGATILVDNYSRATRESENSHSALLKAISAYNTGNFRAGFRNGYVARVIRAPVIIPRNDQDAPPLLTPQYAQQKKVDRWLPAETRGMPRKARVKSGSTGAPTYKNSPAYTAESAVKGW